MRFITEFEIEQSDIQQGGRWPAYLIGRQKANGQIEMGAMLTDSFGWQNPVQGNTLHHRLEIEAFPLDKWVEFKEGLLKWFEDEPIDKDIILTRIKELESYGKQNETTIQQIPG